MVLVDEIRIGRGDVRHELSKFETSPAKALRRLYGLELDFGGRISKLTKTEVTVKTFAAISGSTDVSTYSGTNEEMDLIVRAATIHNIITQQEDVAVTVETLKLLLGESIDITLSVSTLAPAILRYTAKFGFCLLMGVDPASEQARTTSLKDFLAISEMAEAEEISFTQAFDLLVSA